MTLPSSGTITLGMVAAELGIGLPLSLGDTRVLALAGKSGLPISLTDLYGRSAYTPMAVTSTNASSSQDSANAAGTVSCNPYVSASSGSGGYSYQWAFTSNPGGCTLSGATGAACTVSHPYDMQSSGSAAATLQCIVTDSTGHTVTRTGISASLQWASSYTPMSITSTNGVGSYDSANSAGTPSCNPSVSATGGTGGYTYAWSFTSNPNGCALNNPNGASCNVSTSFSQGANGSASATLQCAVTDNTGHVVVKSGITAQLNWASSYTPMTLSTLNGTGGPASSESSGGTVGSIASAAVTGGSGGTSYAWTVTGNPSNCTISALNGSSVSASRSFAKQSSGQATVVFSVTATDNTGHTVTNTGVEINLTWGTAI